MGEMTIAETIQHLYISLTAMVFNIVLILIIRMQGDESGHSNLSFRKVVYAVPIANLVNCASVFLRYARLGFDTTRVWFVVYMLLYLSNIYLAYYLARYIESYFGEEAGRNRYLVRFNLLLVGAATIVILVLIVSGQFIFELHSSVYGVSTWFRMLVGYSIELYFLIYAMTFFLRRRNMLDVRARRTIIIAFLLTILTVILEYFNPTRSPINFLGPTLGLMMFYFGVETADYRQLNRTLAELAEAKEQADIANRSKSDFLARMSHEIRTPINAVLGMNEMILRESNDDHITLYARNVERAGKNLLAIINDILDFSKIEAGKLELVPEAYHLGSVLNDVTNMIVFKAISKGILFSVDVDETLPDKLYGDEVRIRQIMINILNNAVKYTKEGSVKLVIRGDRQPGENGEELICLRISAIDTGVGIRREDINRLFDSFERADLQRNKTVEGAGLGLAITKSLLDMMGGTIRVESVYGEGSTFTVYLPQPVLSEEPVGNFRAHFEENLKEMQMYREGFRAPEARILVVDDTAMNLMVVQGLLKKTQVQIDTATGGVAALELTAANAYDLIFMDQRMPEMDGSQTLRLIRAQREGKNAATPVICLTADAVIGAKEIYLTRGFTDYLSKPVEGRAIEAMLIRYLPPEKVLRRTEGEEAYAGKNDTGAGGDNAASSAEGNKWTELRRFYDEVESLSYEDALRYLDQETLIEDSLRIFWETIRENADELEQSFAEARYKDFTTRVHALKSSARLIGAAALSEDARILEELGNRITDGDETVRSGMEERIRRLLSIYRAYEPVLGDYFGEEETEKEELPAELLEEIYEGIAEFAEIFDLDSIDSLLEQADSYRIPQEEAEHFGEIRSAVRASDWDRLKDLINPQ